RSPERLERDPGEAAPEGLRQLLPDRLVVVLAHEVAHSLGVPGLRVPRLEDLVRQREETGGAAGDEDLPEHAIRVPRRDVLGELAAHAEADEQGLVDAGRVGDRDRVRGQLVEPVRRPRRGIAVAAEGERDRAQPRAVEGLDRLVEVAPRAAPAVHEEHVRRALAYRLVGDVDAVSRPRDWHGRNHTPSWRL